MDSLKFAQKARPLTIARAELLSSNLRSDTVGDQKTSVKLDVGLCDSY